jgi:hypothetical protein
MNEKEPMSPFCEELMQCTGNIKSQKTLSDTALVICTDGISIGCRQCGNIEDAERMIFSKMLNDERFAEIMLQAASSYIRRINTKQEDTDTNSIN